MTGPVRLIPVPALSGIAGYAYAAAVEPSARLVSTAGARPLESDGRTVLGHSDQLVEVGAVGAVRHDG
ncbi:hypothetical protein [Micromonospora avicenniae]|uniref:hypothetical protein n=1 Tax=Micromonospora avicenniae TaxID=1198245 RepID=UPI003F5507D4